MPKERFRIVSTLNTILWLVFISVLVIALTPLTRYLLRPLMVKEDIRKADVIVVLSGGIDKGRYLSLISSQRMVRGSQLYFEGRAKKILFSGGIPEKIGVAEAAVMAQEARRLNIPAADILLEKHSKNIHEQAVEVKKIAPSQQWKSVLLVTSYSRMKRSLMAFEYVGFKVYPAPADPYEKYVDDFFGRLSLFKQLVREYGGMIYYKMRGWI
ncbi:MAG: YdcF family protein [Deltaproteobacteria bacterium]|nr:YdcF family protein [Deltaproteobacteria bacterium]